MASQGDAGDVVAGRLADDTASAHVCRTVPRVAPGTTANEARTALIAEHYESVADIAVCRDDRLVGLVPLEVVLSASGGTRMESLMDPDPPVVAPGTDQEVAAWKAVDHGETSLAVVDASGGFVGLVPPRRLLTVLLAEHDEDLERLRACADCAAPPQHGEQAASPSRAASSTACLGSSSGSWARSPPQGS